MRKLKIIERISLPSGIIFSTYKVAGPLKTG
jgi:hypothetical protein